jgi:proteasome lid subunit RPN8/RPN11
MSRQRHLRPSLAAAPSVRLPSRGVDGSEEIVGLQTASDAVIYPHVFASADREVGGVLVGRSPLDGGLPLVTGAIPALSADEQRATLTFTQESWAHVHRTLERDFPADEQIVGWYHSHPGFGIFLSGHDLFIHENFFSSPSQIALVIDPHARTEGVFAWKGSDLSALVERPTPPNWIVAANPRSPDAGVGNALGADATRGPTRAGYPLLTLVIVGLLGVLIGFGLWRLAEGSSGSGTPAARVGRPVVIEHPSPAPRRSGPAPESHIEVLNE